MRTDKELADRKARLDELILQAGKPTGAELFDVLGDLTKEEVEHLARMAEEQNA